MPPHSPSAGPAKRLPLTKKYHPHQCIYIIKYKMSLKRDKIGNVKGHFDVPSKTKENVAIALLSIVLVSARSGEGCSIGQVLCKISVCQFREVLVFP